VVTLRLGFNLATGLAPLSAAGLLQPLLGIAVLALALKIPRWVAALLAETSSRAASLPRSCSWFRLESVGFGAILSVAGGLAVPLVHSPLAVSPGEPHDGIQSVPVAIASIQSVVAGAHGLIPGWADRGPLDQYRRSNYRTDAWPCSMSQGEQTASGLVPYALRAGRAGNACPPTRHPALRVCFLAEMRLAHN
jgi:hypothetical protein